MLGLPEATRINKPLPKKTIFEKFKPKADDRKRFDAQISRMIIVTEIAPHTVNVKAGEEVTSIFIIQVILKQSECHPNNIVLLSKLIDQKMLFLLQYENNSQLAVYRNNKVLTSDWFDKPLAIELRGHDLDNIWAHLIAYIGDLEIGDSQDLDDAIDLQAKREKLGKKISSLEKRVRKERQPRAKWDLNEELKRLRAELEETFHE